MNILFFADYLSNEIFAYDFKNDSLIIIPANITARGGYETSLAIHPTLDDTILMTTGQGKVLSVKLP